MNIKIKENRSQIVTGSIVCSTQQFAHMLSRSREWLFVFWGFVIPGNRFGHLLQWDYKSPGFIGRTFFYGGFQIRRDAYRKTVHNPPPIVTSRQAFRRICNPSLKTVLTSLCSGDLQSPVIGLAHLLQWDYKSPVFIGRTFFTADFKSVGTPIGSQFIIHHPS